MLHNSLSSIRFTEWADAKTISGLRMMTAIAYGIEFLEVRLGRRTWASSVGVEWDMQKPKIWKSGSCFNFQSISDTQYVYCFTNFEYQFTVYGFYCNTKDQQATIMQFVSYIFSSFCYIIETRLTLVCPHATTLVVGNGNGFLPIILFKLYCWHFSLALHRIQRVTRTPNEMRN